MLPEPSFVGRVQVFPAANGQWYVRAKSANGETLLTSESFTRRWNAMRFAKKLAAACDSIVEEVWL